MGLGPTLCQHTGIERPTTIGRPVVPEGPVVWYLSEVQCSGSGWSASDFRPASNVQGVGRPVVSILSTFWFYDSGAGSQEGLGRPRAGAC